MKKFISLFVFAFLVQLSFSQIDLVKDTYQFPSGSSPEGFIEYNGWIYFTAYFSDYGKELIRTKGIPGEYEIIDLNPGIGSSSPGYFTIVQDSLYFFAFLSNATGTELYASNGTLAGTRLVKDITPGTGSTNIGWMVGGDTKVFFSADVDTMGYEVWVSDGTEAGTRITKNIFMGSGQLPSHGKSYGDTLFFNHTHPTAGKELFITDGTEAGTYMIKDINPSGSSASTLPTKFNGIYYFAASDGVTGWELWRTDGTEAGTWLVKDINPTGYSLPSYFAELNGELFFSARESTSNVELWKTDGTEVGTVLVKEINPSSSQSGIITSELYKFQNKLYFRGDDGIHSNELWVTDGTDAGTKMVKDINPAGGSNVIYFKSSNNKLFFTANDGVNGQEIWVTDGTEAGTKMIKDYGSQDQSLYYAAFLGDTMIYKGYSDAAGSEVYRTDGTENGSFVIHDIVPGNGDGYPRYLTTHNDSLFFNANSKNGYRYYISDGTPAGTDTINMSLSFDFVGEYFFWGDLMFFEGDQSATGEELFATDRTSNGTYMIKDINPGPTSSSIYFWDILDSILLFLATDGTNGQELWRTNGTEAGTYMVKDINPAGNGHYFANNIGHKLNDIMIFAGWDDTYGNELWVTDGTESGTQMIKETLPGVTEMYINKFVRLGDTLYFAWSDGVNGKELWRSDGTASGTYMVKDLNEDPSNSVPLSFMVVDSLMYFTAKGPTGIQTLWESDGTAVGTRIYPQNITDPDTYIRYPVECQGKFYFSNYTAATGNDLWVSDGTAGGTKIIYNNEIASEGPQDIITLGEQIYFVMKDAEHGDELWKSDGTKRGTRMIQDLNPGPDGSNIYDLYIHKGSLFFAAKTVSTDKELYKYTPKKEIKVFSDSTLLHNDTLYLGQVQYNDSSDQFSFGMKNIGPGTINVNSFALSGTDATHFSITDHYQTAHSFGDTSYFHIRFIPKSGGMKYAQVTINSDDPSRPAFILNLEAEGLKADQSVTFNEIVDTTYGDTITLAAASSSGLPVSYSTLNTDLVEIFGNRAIYKGVGFATITASQPGDTIYNAAPDVNQVIEIAKAELTIYADTLSKVFNTPNPPLTMTFAKLLLTDNQDSIDILPTISTTAKDTSSKGVYPVEISGGSDNHYNLTLVNGILVIGKDTAVITISGLIHTFDSLEKQANIAIDPSGLDSSVTYNGNTDLPVNAGKYLVEVTVNDSGYYGYKTDTLTINKATATISLSNLEYAYDGTSKEATVTTNPTGLNTVVTYDGSATAPSGAGNYFVEASIDEINYEGEATDTLKIVLPDDIFDNQVGEIKVHPVPARDFIYIDCPVKAKYQLVNTMGQIMVFGDISNSAILMISHLSKGTYFLNITTHSKTISQIITIE